MVSGFALQARTGLRMVEFGVKGGLTSQNVKYSHASKHDVFDLGTSSKTGYHLGLVSRINLPLFHIQPEMIFTHTSYDITATPSNPAPSHPATRSKVKVNTLEMPVVAGLRLLWFRLQAGPQFTLMTETKFSNKGNITDVDVSKPTMSYILGLGFDMRRINIDVRYNGQFKRSTHSVQYYDTTTNTGVDYKVKMKKWMFSVAYMF